MSYKEEIENALTYAQYDKVIEIYKAIGKEKLENILLEIAFEDEDISTYSFVMYMTEKDKENRKFWLRIAMELMDLPFCWIEGGYSVALHHAKQLLKEEYSVENLICLISFNEIPEKLISDEDAIKIAKEVLILDPNNIRAREVIRKYT